MTTQTAPVGERRGHGAHFRVRRAGIAAPVDRPSSRKQKRACAGARHVRRLRRDVPRRFWAQLAGMGGSPAGPRASPLRESGLGAGLSLNSGLAVKSGTHGSKIPHENRRESKFADPAAGPVRLESPRCPPVQGNYRGQATDPDSVSSRGLRLIRR